MDVIIYLMCTRRRKPVLLPDDVSEEEMADYLEGSTCKVFIDRNGHFKEVRSRGFPNLHSPSLSSGIAQYLRETVQDTGVGDDGG